MILERCFQENEEIKIQGQKMGEKRVQNKESFEKSTCDKYD